MILAKIAMLAVFGLAWGLCIYAMFMDARGVEPPEPAFEIDEDDWE